MGVEYDHQGKYEEALKHYLRALEIREKKLGSGHPTVATTLYNIGSVYRHQGKYEEALQYYLRALEIRENKLGSDHPDVAGTLNNIGSVYDDQVKYEEALPYYLSGYGASRSMALVIPRMLPKRELPGATA
jgi:tetratricopeptide (TPR) repeat protein